MEEFDKLFKNEKQSVYVNGGASTCSLIGIAFIVLKLVGCIDWSWWWVLAPFWIPVCVAVVLGLIIFFLLRLAKKNLYKELDKTLQKVKQTQKEAEEKADNEAKATKEEKPIENKTTPVKKDVSLNIKVKEDTPKRKPRKKKVTDGESAKKNG